MRLLIWGVSNIGKTTIGKELSKKLNCKFYDVDDEIIDIYGSIDNFQEIFPNDYDRFDEKEELMMNIIDTENKDFIMAVSPIFSSSVVEELLDTDTISIEIIDTPEAIYDRLILKGDDALEYKERHKEHYMQEIKWDQVASFNEFKDIPKVHVDNQSISETVETVFNYLKENKIIS
jgi:shikimate kinase